MEKAKQERLKNIKFNEYRAGYRLPFAQRRNIQMQVEQVESGSVGKQSADEAPDFTMVSPAQIKSK